VYIGSKSISLKSFVILRFVCVYIGSKSISLKSFKSYKFMTKVLHILTYFIKSSFLVLDCEDPRYCTCVGKPECFIS